MPGQRGDGELLAELTPSRTYAMICTFRDRDDKPPTWHSVWRRVCSSVTQSRTLPERVLIQQKGPTAGRAAPVERGQPCSPVHVMPPYSKCSTRRSPLPRLLPWGAQWRGDSGGVQACVSSDGQARGPTKGRAAPGSGSEAARLLVLSAPRRNRTYNLVINSCHPVAPGARRTATDAAATTTSAEGEHPRATTPLKEHPVRVRRPLTPINWCPRGEAPRGVRAAGLGSGDDEDGLEGVLRALGTRG